MEISKIKEIENYKAKIAALEKEIAAERAAKLASLHLEVGLDSTEALIKVLKGLSKAPPPKKGKRTRLTPGIKKNIANAIKAGLKGTQAARKYGVSVPTIQNIKKEFGLVKNRVKKSAAKQAAQE